MTIQPNSPTEVLANRIPHANGVTWVFHDLATGFVRHVNVPNIPPVAQQQPNQRSAQNSHGNEMVLYQSPSNQATQQAARTTSAAQPMTTPSAPSALPIASPALQPVSTDGHQIDWVSKIAEVMRDQFGLKPKQQNLMYRTPYPVLMINCHCPTSTSFQISPSFLDRGKSP